MSDAPVVCATGGSPCSDVGRPQERNNGAVRPIDILILCPAGFEGIVAAAASRELPKFVEAARSGGLVRGSTVAPVRQLRAFACATNVFAVVDQVPRGAIDGEARALSRRLVNIARPSGLPSKGTLRLRIHVDGRFTSTTGHAAVALEDALATWSGLRVSRSQASVEMWMLRRTESRDSVLAIKLSDGQRCPERGVLRPEICAALARVEPLRDADLVMDPFAGSGAIGTACLEAGARSVWMNDVAGDQRGARPTKWTHEDFRQLRVDAGSLDAVVTDPPWGHFSTVGDGLDNLYADLGTAAREWLRARGAVVLLTAAPESTTRLLLERGALGCELELPVLVNGRKARVIRARKLN